ncbi:MAG: IS200/IS605 family transposase [Nanoarchaeota archaeon]
MKTNPVGYSSMVGESWHHFSFKVKYCHPIFENQEVREACNKYLIEAFERNKLRYEEIGFDRDHVHGMIDIGLYSRPQIAKLVKGYVAKKLFNQFPEIKKKYFYGSGLWNPASWIDAVGKNKDFMKGYIRKQRYYIRNVNQLKLEDYF